MIKAKWDGEKDPFCQRCSDREETFQHIFSCTSKNVSDTFSKGLVTFRTAIRKANTAPIVISAFETMFLSFRKGYLTTPKKHHYQSNEMNDLVHATLEHQRKIGEKFFVQGFISSNWEIPQNLYLGKQDFNDNTTDWSTKVIRAIWKLSCSMWKARCDYIHGNKTGRSTCARRKEPVSLIQTELKRTEHHAEHTTRQLRCNMLKSLGNARIAALEIWLDMLRNVKGEIFLKKHTEGIQKTRAQPITIFFRRLAGT